MPVRFPISPWLRLSLLLTIWLGGWWYLDAPLVTPERTPQRVQAGHQAVGQQPELTLAHLQEHAALLPAAPDVPVGTSSGAWLPAVFSWPELVWPSAVGRPAALQACAVPDLFRVRLLLTALSPNAP
ncbi:hypothetical protein SAMN06265337_2646 [Hymenobacter gelipurpurascens]|uniref:Uncharacterized protein n=1 Tax=Hymenobacter gelipurpurascens TaxID=89968 RepID=A0A212UAB0_9BACT|nr:hypothetical protein [Hymenobacter gelipurpurascens]SNC74984.1 hypothetical protein SAMN06265337_2646 [Hymenobacter gelipurpurascens]